jgi:hypothetical protein
MARINRRQVFVGMGVTAAAAFLDGTAAIAQDHGDAGLDAPQAAVQFSVIMTIIGMVLGIGFTRMLSGLIAVYRSRQKAILDWVPLSWAFCILLTDLQFWWAINGASGALPVWTFDEFVALVVFTMLLFVSGALLLPPAELQKDESLRTFFDEEGRWALAFLSAYFLLTLIVNVTIFHVRILRPWAAIELAMAVLVFAAYRARSSPIQRLLAAAAVPIFVIYSAIFSDDRLFQYFD